MLTQVPKTTVHSYKPKSSNIDHVEWNADNGEMNVTFKNGTTYAYSNVPQVEFHRLVSAKSAGQHFSENVRGKYQSRKLGG